MHSMELQREEKGAGSFPLFCLSPGKFGQLVFSGKEWLAGCLKPVNSPFSTPHQLPAAACKACSKQSTLFFSLQVFSFRWRDETSGEKGKIKLGSIFLTLRGPFLADYT